MCGITGYIGHREVYPILINGLKRLEYRVLKEMADNPLEIPRSHPAVAPLLAIIPLQLLAYQVAVERGCNVDQPRNLAKSVTVE